MKDLDLRDMCRVDLEDEVMLLRAQVRVLQNQAALDHKEWQNVFEVKDNEMYSLKRQLGALVCACCDAPDLNMDEAPFPSEGRT